MHSRYPGDGLYGIHSGEAIYSAIPPVTARTRVLARFGLARRAFELFPHAWIEGTNKRDGSPLRWDENEYEREEWLKSALESLGLRDRGQHECDMAEVKASGGLRVERTV